jgi:hypothetical protein
VDRVKELIGFIAERERIEQETKERQALIESRVKALNKAGAEAHQRTMVNKQPLSFP